MKRECELEGWGLKNTKTGEIMLAAFLTKDLAQAECVKFLEVIKIRILTYMRITEVK